MDIDELIDQMSPVFQDTVNNNIILKPELTAYDVEGWDSLANLRFLVSLEQEFGVRFNMSEMNDVKNIGDLAILIIKMLNKKSQ